MLYAQSFSNIFHFFSDILCTMCYVKIVNYYSFTERAVLLMIKKHFKKLVSVALTAVMALGMTTTAFANEKDTLNLDAALMEKGYPQIVLDTMDEDTKMDIYNEGDIAFCGAVITYYDENSGTYSEIDVNEDGTYIAPRGQISTSDLSLSFTYSRSPAAKNTKLSYIKVTYNYNWLNLPFFRWQDPTSVSWDDSKFQMTDNSFSKVDKYDGYVIGPNGELLGPYTNQTHSSENGYANASNAGVSWYADLKGYIGVQPTKLYGSGTFKLAPKSTTTSGSTTLYGHYVHPKAELGLSVNVSSYGSFSISGGSNYDERGSQKTISW